LAGFPRPENNINIKFNGHGNRAPTIGNVIAYFKYQTTKPFIWQRSFYDHIIRNDASVNTIREYIRNNPEHGMKMKTILTI